MDERMKMDEEVSWEASKGKITGEVVMTSDTRIEGNEVWASRGNPQIIAERDKPKKQTAPKP